MAFIFRKFREAVNTLAKSPKFARDPRHIQFEADINRLFLYTSYNRLGSNADEKDAEEIIDMAAKASVVEQQRQVQENIHHQIKNLCSVMDDILRPEIPDSPLPESQPQGDPRRSSGLSFAVGSSSSSSPQKPAVPQTRRLSRNELSHSLRDRIGYTADVLPSRVPHEKAGLGLFLSGEARVGSVVAFYPGVVYSPAYYQYIPGYPRIDNGNSYLITRYDSVVINARPWGVGGEWREEWNGLHRPELETDSPEYGGTNSDRVWKMLCNPRAGDRGMVVPVEVLERRNPLAFGHFANHPARGAQPNVMVCPYDFPLAEGGMRVYIPNVVFGVQEEVRMRRFGSFWFRSLGSGAQAHDVPVMKTLVLLAMRPLCEEEAYLNYRLSNSKRWPSWYSPVDEDEDKRRWS